MSSSEAENINKNINARGAAVLNVGNPGNKGGTGRPKSEIRAAAAQGFDSVMPQLLAIANGEIEVSPSEKLKAIDLLGKYGGLQQVDQTSGDEPLQITVKYDEPEDSNLPK